ncbi:GNAT family N-acetyltransferase [Chitinophaga lutea]|uniref:GNAT family N-acetyltransferase n=1 Tax=Chitinophaga lutea TaxID=2488634 RepID=A0A3N4Q0T4_9BACT|nr:GNAT family N-acetyltransferase [Chitinophaga lutea]RPE09560.1 GNAT family N-acetyltransferase [Chitinophaga lutea]
METNIRKLLPADLAYFTELIRLFEDVFEMKDFHIPGNAHLQQLLDDEKFMAFAAFDEQGKVTGGLTAYVLVQYYSVKPLVYVFDLAVNTSLQRRGIGRKLIAAINEYCKAAGMEEVFIQADVVDEYAVEFYHATGGIAENVVHFYYPLNK